MIEELRPYTEYKESGLPWLGRLPRDWRVLPLCRVASPKSDCGRPELELLSVYLHRGVIRYSESGGQVHKPSLDLSNYQIVEPGDFVLNNQQAWRGSIGVSRYQGIISPAYLIMQLSSSLNPSYANLMFRSPAMVAQYVVASRGVGDIQRNLYYPDLRASLVPIPPPDEQAAIVRFLDHANRKIESFIRAKQKLIALLGEQKQTIIHRAVTHGLNPNAPLKPSGIHWLGDIPRHWEVKRIKYLLKEVDNRSKTGAEPLLSMRMHHGLVVFAEHFTRPPQAASLVGFKIVKPGQFVVNRMQAGNGVIYPSNLAFAGLVSPDYAVFDPIADVNVVYLGELFRSRTVRTKFRSESKGLGTGTSGFLRLYNDRFGAIHIPLPPRQEQDSILRFLGEELADLNTAIARTEREIALMQEYRTRLTADVVTGKLDVRVAAAKLFALPDASPGPAIDEPLEEIELEEIP
jgi:type I restriction enzyme, S subunit